MNSMEVYRISPQPGKYYSTAVYTTKEGKWPHERYFTTRPLQYVGEFRHHVSHGYRDNAMHADVFWLDGKEVVVPYTYDGTTCFVEVFKDKIDI